MYIANQHRISTAKAIEFARRTGVGELISIHDSQLQATRIPFIIVPNDQETSSADDTEAQTGAQTAQPAVSPLTGDFGDFNALGNTNVNGTTNTSAIMSANENLSMRDNISEPAPEFHIETHLSQVNPQWRGLDNGQALLVVNVADQHVPGHLLPEEREFDRLPQVPTWNYLTVHIRGSLEAIHDREWKIAHLKRFVDHFEPKWRPESHSNYERLNHALPALVGIKMRISEIVGKAKLHQQLASDQISVLAEKLHAADATNEIAQLMGEISVPWAKDRESRVELARSQKTLPIINK